MEIDKVNRTINSRPSSPITDYISNVNIMNKLTGNEYHARLDIFKDFVETKYSLDVDSVIFDIKNKNQDPYSLLTEYARYLEERNISALYAQTTSCNSEKLS